MPTINQLVRKGRKTGVTKSTAPAFNMDGTPKTKINRSIELHKKEVYVQL